jgi:hypothetical protein
VARIDDGIAILRRRSVWARSLIGVYIAIHALFLLWGAYILWRELSTGFGLAYILIAPLASPFGLLSFVAAAIPVLLWIHRAGTNLIEGGVNDLEHAPGWAVASYFIPVINLFVPMKAMRELCNRSNGEDVWQAKAAVGDVSAWWSCFIAGNLVQAWLIFTYSFNVLTNLEILTPPGVNSGLGVFAIALLIGAAVFLFRIIGTVTRAQNSMTGVAQTFS